MPEPNPDADTDRVEHIRLSLDEMFATTEADLAASLINPLTAWTVKPAVTQHTPMSAAAFVIDCSKRG